MAKAKVPIDQFVNRAIVSLAMAVANTIEFVQINFGVGTFQGVGLILHRLEFSFPESTLDELAANTDSLFAGLVTRDSITALDPVSQDVIGMISIMMNQDHAAGEEKFVQPLIRDFSSLPGGGLIMPANPLFLGMDTVGFAAGGEVDLVMYYTFKELSDKDYIELIQTLVPGNF